MNEVNEASPATTGSDLERLVMYQRGFMSKGKQIALIFAFWFAADAAAIYFDHYDLAAFLIAATVIALFQLALDSLLALFGVKGT